MTKEPPSQNLAVHYIISFKKLCFVTLLCPLISLVVCLVTGFLFQPDDIHETHCRVYNIIPSISAITGISPQRYLWRISIALHIGPRFIFAAVYKAYHLNLVNKNAKKEIQTKARFWLSTTFWLNICEVSSLCGVTYISNRENYPVHEKLFILFMVSSLCHMATCIKAMKSVGESRNELHLMEKNISQKTTLFVVSLVSTVGLVGFFLEHRYLCHNMAFSWFAFCEYVIAVSNMAFHVTLILDFPTEYLIVAKKNKFLKCN